MPPSNQELYRATVTFDMPDQTIAQNVYAWMLSDPTGLIDVDQDIGDCIQTALTTMYGYLLAYLDAAVTIRDVAVEAIAWATDHWEIVRWLGAWVLDDDGTGATQMMPHGVAALVGAGTNSPFTRARKYIPGIAEGAIDGGTLSSAFFAALANYGAEWVSNQLIETGAQLIPKVLSTGGPNIGTAKELTTYAATDIPAYQRRRKPGVGV